MATRTIVCHHTLPTYLDMSLKPPVSPSRLGRGGYVAGPADREKTKRIVYSVMYGAGPGKLAEFLQIPAEEAIKIINSFVGMYPALRSYPRRLIAQCKAQGYLCSLSGRRRLFPKICSVVPAVSSHAQRQAINFVIQGSAADICKSAMIEIEKRFAEHTDLRARLLLQIHDELLWEVPDEQVQRVADIVRSTMENTSALCGHMTKLSVALPVSVATGGNWGAMTSST